MTERGAGLGWVVRVLLLWSLSACADSHGGGLKPHESTETGNPPVIDVSRVALVIASDDVHVTGEAGAVTPGGGTVEVERLVGGAVARGDVDRDGSFDVEVEGTLDDTYALRAVGEGGAQTSPPVYLYRGGAMVGSADGGAFSCEQRKDIIVEQFAQVQDGAERACESNADCKLYSADVNCPANYCTGTVVSYDGLPAVASALGAIGEGLCAPFAADDCFNGMPVPSCMTTAPIACVAGQCVDCAEPGACDEATCGACTTPLITWSSSNGLLGSAAPFDQHSLVDCSTYTFTAAAGGTCSRSVPCIGGSGSATWAHVQNALGDPVVQAALADGTSFGAINPGGAYDFALQVGDQSTGIFGPECGDQPNCIDPPQALLDLQLALDYIEGAHACPPGT